MSVKHKPTVAAYVANHADAIAVLQNLLEFVESCPAPDENGELHGGGIDYGYTGSFGQFVQHLRDAAEIADEMCK
jgi:hypothetical protein